MSGVSEAKGSSAFTPAQRLRILCLHGSHQTSQVFRDRISRLVSQLSKMGLAEMSFVDGPIVLLPEDGGASLRGWYDEGANDLTESLIALDQCWSARRYDGVLGFSAGALAAAVVASSPDRFPGCRFAIVASSPASPAPSAWLGGSAQRVCVPSLHLLSSQDRAVPASASSDLLEAWFDVSLATVYEHPKGHALPCRAADLDAIATFLRERVLKTNPSAASTAASDTSSTAPPPPPKTPAQKAPSAKPSAAKPAASKPPGLQPPGLQPPGLQPPPQPPGQAPPAPISAHDEDIYQSDDDVRARGTAPAPQPLAQTPSTAPSTADRAAMGACMQVRRELEAWAEELSALEAIYADDLQHDESDAGEKLTAEALSELLEGAAGGGAAAGGRAEALRAARVGFSVRLDGGGEVDPEQMPPAELRLHCLLGRGYPHVQVPPRLTLVHQMLRDQLPPSGAAAVVEAARTAAVQALDAGEASTIYLAVTAANEALAEGRWRGGGGGEEGEGGSAASAGAAAGGDVGRASGAGAGAGAGMSAVEEATGLLLQEDEAATVLTVRRMAEEAHAAVAALSAAELMGADTSTARGEGCASLRGAWAYRVGLVGKPSAGKSSLFNALTRAGLSATGYEKSVGGGAVVAKVGAAPFTTIQPNVGEAR